MKKTVLLIILVSIFFYNYNKIDETFFQMKLSRNQLSYDKDYFFDLNGDAKDEKVELKSYKDNKNNFIVDLYINDELKETYKDKNHISAYINDFNKMDKHKEICIILGNNIEKSKVNIFIYYDKDETNNFIISGRIINNDDKNGTIKITYGSTEDSLNFNNYSKVIGENSITINYLYKRILHFGMVDIEEKEVEVIGESKEKEYVAKYEITVYETNIGDAKAYTLSKGDKIKLVSLYNYKNSKSIKIVNEEGRYGWIKVENKQLFEEVK